MISILLLCCAGKSEPTPTPAPSPAPAPAPAPAPEPGSVLGSWRSAPCGDRTWERTITLNADRTYSGSDPVSPCPPGAQCIWSGVVSFSGTWVEGDGGRIELTETKGTHAEQYPRPAWLVPTPEGGLVDSVNCGYARE